MIDWLFHRPWAVIVLSLLVSFAVVALIIGPILFFAGKADARFHEKWDGAAIVRICRDGSQIYRLRDGRITTGSFEVEDIETVCGAVK